MRVQMYTVPSVPVCAQVFALPAVSLQNAPGGLGVSLCKRGRGIPALPQHLWAPWPRRTAG